MIVLRIDTRSHSADVRWAGAEAVLGSGPDADVVSEEAGWAGREAVLVHSGRHALLVCLGTGETMRLHPGESAHLGAATVTLVGIAPLAPAAEIPGAAGPDTVSPPTPGIPSAPPAAEPPVPFELAPLPTPAAAAAPPASGAAGEPTGPTAQVKFELAELPAPVAAPRAITAPAAPADPRPAKATAPEAHASRSRFGAPAFEDELLAILRRSPWFLLSAVLHGLLLALLLVLGPRAPGPRTPLDPYGLLTANTQPDDPLLSGGPETPAPELPPEEFSAPDDAEPEEPPPAELMHAPDPAPEARPATDTLTKDDEADAPPPVLAPSRAAAGAKVPRRFAAPPEPYKPAEGTDDAHARDLNRRAAARLRDEALRGGGALGRALKGLRTRDVLVVLGAFDHMEVVLEELGLPFTTATPQEVGAGIDLSGHKAVFWNCGQSPLGGAARRRAAESIREFVRAGGYLFTTDWALEDLVIPAFPGVVESSSRRDTLPELVVGVQPVSPGHPLLEGVLAPDEPLRWWLERSSHDVRVVDRSRVTVLLEAPELAGPRWRRGTAVAVTWQEGRGRVLHLVGHHYQQKTDLRGAVGAQRLPLNFLRMRVEEP